MPQIRLHTGGPGKSGKGKLARKRNPGTTAFHGKAIDGIHHLVGIGDLRVVIVPDGDFWFAQGLEIDYAAQGESVKDAKRQFSDGLYATIEEHLQIYGNIENLLNVSPTEVWKEAWLSAGAIPNRYSTFSLYHVERQAMPEAMQQVLPFQGINYFEVREQAA